jgi:hypothetical protein
MLIKLTTPTFYELLFRTLVFCEAFLCLQFEYLIFWSQKLFINCCWIWLQDGDIALLNRIEALEGSASGASTSVTGLQTTITGLQASVALAATKSDLQATCAKVWFGYNCIVKLLL